MAGPRKPDFSLNPKENKHFDLRIHHQLLRNGKTLPEEADSQRKCVAHLIKHCDCDTFSNADISFELDKKLKCYQEVSRKVQEGTYNDKLKSLLSRTENVVCNNFSSQLSTINPKEYIKALPCSTVKSYCVDSENINKEEEFSDFIEVFKNKKSSNSRASDVPSSIRNRVYPRQQENKYLITNKITSEIGNKRDENSSLGIFSNCFKTAKEELEIQSLQKYGNEAQSSASSGGVAQKRKFGKLGVRGKFIPPVKSNSGSNENMFYTEKEHPPDIDERLKNIEPKMVELIKSEIMDCGASLNWNDIAGLSFAKTAIQEAVVWPMLRPDIFTGLRRPPKGILLFGPPGTGKTLIGKCVASQSKSTFFSISASSLTSKWVGDGEKMVRALFTVARVHQPAVIFIDEVDSLLSQRSDSEHESSRRIKTEFLVQLDGATTDSEERLLIIGATNRPQELDEAARRRFVKRLYIPLPEYDARLQLLKKLISSENHQIQDEDFQKVAALSEGYSGADIKSLCSEASLGPIRSIDMNLIEHIQASDVRPLLKEDFEKALMRVRSSVAPKDLEQYVSWNSIYGSGF